MTFLLFLLLCGEKNEGGADLSTIKDLIEDTIVSTQPAMMVNLKACSAGAGVVRLSLPVIFVPQTLCPRVLLRAEARAGVQRLRLPPDLRCCRSWGTVAWGVGIIRNCSEGQLCLYLVS